MSFILLEERLIWPNIYLPETLLYKGTVTKILPYPVPALISQVIKLF